MFSWKVDPNRKVGDDKKDRAQNGSTFQNSWNTSPDFRCQDQDRELLRKLTSPLALETIRI